MMYQSKTVYGALMQMITSAVSAYLRAQIRAGAQAVQIFDTWAGVLAPQDFKVFALPYVKKIIEELRPEGAPVIYFVNGCAGLLKEIKASGADIVGVDWRMDIGEAVRRLGKDCCVQGNLDPCALFLPAPELKKRTRDILKKAGKAKGHIFNLGHGVLPETTVESAKFLVDSVHELSRKSSS
jgi:uroporphyrinogen decarboxylase